MDTIDKKEELDELKMVDKDVLAYIIEKKTFKKDPEAEVVIIPKIPTEILVQYVLRAQAENKKLLIIHTQGAYNPPHIGHINMILDAKDAVENSGGYILLAAYMSPSPDNHINKKKSESVSKGEDYLHLNFDERCYLIEKMISNLGYQDWIFVNRYEGINEKVAVTKTWINMQEFALQSIQENKEAFKSHGILLERLNKIIEVAFLVGSDKLNYPGRTMDEFSKEVKVNDNKYHLPIIIKQRDDQNNERSKAKMAVYLKYKKEEQKEKKIFVCTDRENFSSTQFRDYIKKHSKK